jgi:hypothetical protein
MQTVSSSSITSGSIAVVPVGVAAPSHQVGAEKAFFSGAALPNLTQNKKKLIVGINKSRIVGIVSKVKIGADEGSTSSSVSSIAATSMTVLLSNVGAAHAISKEDVDNAYFTVEKVTAQVTSTAGNVFETAKGVFDKVILFT